MGVEVGLVSEFWVVRYFGLFWGIYGGVVCWLVWFCVNFVVVVVFC